MLIMNLIFWNIRGLNGRSNQTLLRERMIAEQPDIMFLQETKCAMEEMDRVISRCWKQGKIIFTDATGTAGGLAILWNPCSVLMENFFTTRWSISAEYMLIGSNKSSFLTNVYGPASPRAKATFIRNLEGIETLTTSSRWILGGDFNMICNLDKKRGGIRRLEAESEHFQALIDKLGLIDLETQNGLYTWSTRRSRSQQVACHLGQFLISNSLLMDGLALEASVLDSPESCHWPIQLWLDILGSLGRKPFRFERFWLIHPNFQTMAPIWWKEATSPHGSKMYRFQQKLKSFNQRLKIWNK